MLDIVFDFSSSPVGGGLRRLEAYAAYFVRSPLRTCFLVHPKVHRRVAAVGVDAKAISRGALSKACASTAYLRSFEGDCEWFFSYGIPVHRRVGILNWFHVSNVLPFALSAATVDLRLLLKMKTLLLQCAHAAANCDVVSGESRFTLARYRASCGDSSRSVLLANGLAEGIWTDPDAVPRAPRAVTVGTESYKRLDRVIEVYDSLRERYGLEALEVVGSATALGGRARSRPDIVCTGFLDDRSYFDRLARARVLISASEVENSSVAVLEGLALCEYVVLSDIPSHRELVERVGFETTTVGHRGYLISHPKGGASALPTWHDVIAVMTAAMDLQTPREGRC